MLRSSNRPRTQPSWLSYFVSNQVTTSTSCKPYIPIEIVSSVSSDHEIFLEQLSIIEEPCNYTQARKYPYWVQPMNDELYALERNHTWQLTTSP